MSQRRRWRAPSMNSEGVAEQARGSSPRVRLDEKVVRKMLQVNPDMRAGRTTFQVKRDLENGTKAPGACQPSQPGHPSQSGQPPLSRLADPPVPGVRDVFADTLGFFVRGKADGLYGRLDDIAKRRRALDEEEAQARRYVLGQLVSFVALLDETQVALHAVTTLSRYRDFLTQLGASPAEVLESVRRSRPNHR